MIKDFTYIYVKHGGAVEIDQMFGEVSFRESEMDAHNCVVNAQAKEEHVTPLPLPSSPMILHRSTRWNCTTGNIRGGCWKLKRRMLRSVRYLRRCACDGAPSASSPLLLWFVWRCPCSSVPVVPPPPPPLVLVLESPRVLATPPCWCRQHTRKIGGKTSTENQGDKNFSFACWTRFHA